MYRAGIYEDEAGLNTPAGCLNRSLNIARLPEAASDTCQRRVQQRRNTQVPSPLMDSEGRKGKDGERGL